MMKAQFSLIVQQPETREQIQYAPPASNRTIAYSRSICTRRELDTTCTKIGGSP